MQTLWAKPPTGSCKLPEIVRLLPASKRGAVHLTARKATHMLANMTFFKVFIFANLLLVSYNRS